jgi:hypothetical protein
VFHKIFGINSSYVPIVHKTVEFSDGGFEFHYATKLKKFTNISYMRFVLKSAKLNLFTFLSHFAKL